MKKLSLPVRATDITDRDFWNSLRVPPKACEARVLAEAIRLGRGGKQESAFAALADYHRAALKGEWAIIREAWHKMPAPDPVGLRDLLRHKINVWHTQVVQFGRKIEWWPDWLAPDNIYGLHRLHWCQPAINAFIRGGDTGCRDFLIDIVDQYDGARRHPRWKDIRQVAFNSLEISAKWPSLLAMYLAFLHGGGIPRRTAGQIMRLFLGFGRSISATLGTYIPGYNAQAAGFSTLLHLARRFPEFRESPAWDRQAVRLVSEHARKGFFGDGGNRERVWGYGTMHVNALCEPYEVARRSGGLGGHERQVRSTIRRACRWYIKTAGPPPLYAFPTYGDAGWALHDRLPTIQAMARCLPESARSPLLGVDRTRGHLLKPSGFAVLRNGDDVRASYVNVNFGKFAGWHSHWDLLSMNLWAFGEPLLEELCRFGPYANPLDQLFRAPESHNLVLIDGMIYDCRDVRGEDVQWFSNDLVEYFSAYHRAYRYFVFGRGGTPVSPNIEAKIRRTVVLVKNPGYVIVMDSVQDLNSPIFKGAISQYWHAPKPFRVVRPGAARTEGRTACLLVQARTDGLHRLDASKDFGGAEIAHLGHGYERYCLRARRWMPINHRGISGFTTVLYPFQGRMPAVSVSPLPMEGASPWKTEAIRIVSPAGTDVVVLNPERVTGFAWHHQPMTARAYVRLGNRRGEQTIR